MNKSISNLFALLFVIVACSFCSKVPSVDTSGKPFLEHRHKMDSLATHSSSVEELKSLLNASLKTEDDVAAMCFYRELGKRNRDSSDFQGAISCHKEAIALAKKIKDTLGIITMLNQQGTNYRRINALDMASDCYYEAIEYADLYSGEETRTFTKVKVSSLNGLGNIYKTIGNDEHAERLFRRALEGEEKLNSHLGIAINTANLGAICESRGQLDSALAYYRKSFEENSIAKSALGVALCYGHFGRIHEKKGQLDSSLVNYTKAVSSLEKDADKWHWLGSCIALTRVNHLLGNDDAASDLLDDALKTAKEINSWYHLNVVYQLRAEIHEKSGQWKTAMEDLISASAYRDSLEYEKQLNHVQSLQSEYNDQQTEEALAEEKRKTEEVRHQKSLILWAGFAVLILLLGVVYLLMYSLRMRSRNFEAKMMVEKARQEFFTNVTHDFRTPLTVITGQAGMIRSRNKNKDDVESAEAIIRQSDVLMDLINQILDISKAKSSIGKAEWRRGNIQPLIIMAVENARLAAAGKNISVNYSHSAELDGNEIDFIPDFMGKVFSNLLSNAVKYTGEGGEINVYAALDNGRFIWKVSDNGMGIRKEDMANLFTPFFRSEAALGQPGHGIGLSIVRQMVESMDGQVTVDSTEGKGSEFTVSIPSVHSKTDAIQPYFHPYSSVRKDEREMDGEILDNDSAGAEKPIVLIVEDSKDIASYIRAIFGDKYRICTANNGQSGLSAIDEYVPDLIITDLMMPGVDGYELCRRVRSSEVLNHIPIVVVTAKDSEEDRLKAIHAGADAFLIKPFNADELLMIVHNLLERRRLLREKYSAEIKDTNDISTVTANNPNTDQFLAKMTAAIISNLVSSDLSPEFLADKLCLSVSSLNRKMKSITGMSTSSFITATKISVAKKMLTTTDKTIGEISDLCGFEYQSYFSRIFKNQTGCTPAEYRTLTMR